MRKFRLFALLVVGAALGGCAIGNKYDYRAATPAVSVKSDKQVVVAVVGSTAGGRFQGYPCAGPQEFRGRRVPVEIVVPIGAGCRGNDTGI